MKLFNKLKNVLRFYEDYETYRNKTLKSFESTFNEIYTNNKIATIDGSGQSLKLCDIENDLVQKSWKETISKKVCDPNVFLRTEFIEEFACYIDWDNLCKTRDLSESFLETFSEFLNFKIVFAYQFVSQSFIEKHRNKVRSNKKDLSWLLDEPVEAGTLCGPIEIIPTEEKEYITFDSEDIKDSPYFISCDPASKSKTNLIVKTEKENTTNEGTTLTVQSGDNIAVWNDNTTPGLTYNYDYAAVADRNSITINGGDINLNGNSLIDFINNVNERLKDIEDKE